MAEKRGLFSQAESDLTRLAEIIRAYMEAGRGPGPTLLPPELARTARAYRSLPPLATNVVEPGSEPISLAPTLLSPGLRAAAQSYRRGLPAIDPSSVEPGSVPVSLEPPASAAVRPRQTLGEELRSLVRPSVNPEAAASIARFMGGLAEDLPERGNAPVLAEDLPVGRRTPPFVPPLGSPSPEPGVPMVAPLARPRPVEAGTPEPPASFWARAWETPGFGQALTQMGAALTAPRQMKGFAGFANALAQGAAAGSASIAEAKKSKTQEQLLKAQAKQLDESTRLREKELGLKAKELGLGPDALRTLKGVVEYVMEPGISDEAKRTRIKATELILGRSGGGSEMSAALLATLYALLPPEMRDALIGQALTGGGRPSLAGPTPPVQAVRPPGFSGVTATPK